MKSNCPLSSAVVAVAVATAVALATAWFGGDPSPTPVATAQGSWVATAFPVGQASFAQTAARR